MDFSNQLGIIYYVLNRSPSTRYYHIDEAATLNSQMTAIDEIRRSNLPVVVYSSTAFGLSVFDYVPMMIRDYVVSAYLLDHYRPVVNVGGELILVRNDVAAQPQPLPKMRTPASTSNLYFSSYACDFGDIFNFYATPENLSSRPHLNAQLVATGTPGVSRLALPPGTNLLRYRWISFHATTSLGSIAFVISDAMGAPPSHSIDVETLPLGHAGRCPGQRVPPVAWVLRLIAVPERGRAGGCARRGVAHSVSGRRLLNEPAVLGPTRHGAGAQPLVEVDGLAVPLEDFPLHPSVGAPAQVVQQGARRSRGGDGRGRM